MIVDPSHFWSLVDRTGDCWVWTGNTSCGYGHYRTKVASRVAYEITVGPIPAGLEIDHLCRTPICVNPGHLEPVTRDENMRRRSVAQTHCLHGHEFTPENTYERPVGKSEGRRTCRACNAESVRRYARKRSAA